MPRLRLFDFRNSRGPKVLGFCRDNQPLAAEFVNGAQRRLILAREAGDEGWWGTWAEMAFTGVTRTNPYITCPREIARIEKLQVCDRWAPVQNQFYEYLDFGNGRMPKQCATTDWVSCQSVAFSRNNAVTFSDPTLTDFIVRIYTNNSTDIGAVKRVLIQGTDANGIVVRNLDGTKQVDGEFLTVDSPFIDSALHYSRLTGIQKDVTQGDISIFQVDPSTGDERLLLVMAPGETVAGYRRYYLNALPSNCCASVGAEQELRVTAIVKMQPIDVAVDTDYLLLHNLEALIEECISIRLSEIDDGGSQQLSRAHHQNAIRLLNGELVHFLGKENPAVQFKPFGTATLERLNVGMM